MRQAGLPPTGNWIGSATGGVKAPAPVLLPDAGLRFAATAARLDVLAQDHPMAEWLRFMARLSRAQHVAATAGSLPADGDTAAMEQALTERRPPLAADEGSLGRAWHERLTVLLADLDRADLPGQPAAAIAALRASDVDALEALARSLSLGHVDPSDAAKAVFVAAALQVHFTLRAARLPVDQVQLLPERGLCPCCGSAPVVGIITATGDTPGTRYLHCALCATAWNHVRAVCIACGASGKVQLKGIEGGSEAVKAETCDDCQTYSKLLYRARDMQLDAYADDLATLGLDLLVSEAGYARRALNPLLLVG